MILSRERQRVENRCYYPDGNREEKEERREKDRQWEIDVITQLVVEKEKADRRKKDRE